MRLYHAEASPFVRKIMVMLHELDRLDQVEIKTVATNALKSDAGLSAANPLARIPSLERPDGGTLYDSRVISAFLDDQFDGGLYPSGSVYWDVLTLEATGDGISDSAVSMTYEVRLRPETEQSPDWIEAQWAKVERALDVLNARWMGHLAGPMTMGQISVACALGYLDLRHDARNWRLGRDGLARWYSTFAERPSMQSTRPDG